MDRPLSYYSRKSRGKPSLSSVALPRPTFGTKGHMAKHNRYDYYSGKELLALWEDARDKLAEAATLGESVRLMETIKGIQSSKNWKP